MKPFLLFVLGESEELIAFSIQASRQPNGIPNRSAQIVQFGSYTSSAAG